MVECLIVAVRALRVADPDLGLKPLLAKLREQQPDLEAGTREVREALVVLKAESEAAAAAPKECSAAAAAAPAPAKKKSGSCKKPAPLLAERFGGLTMREWTSAKSVRHLVASGAAQTLTLTLTLLTLALTLTLTLTQVEPELLKATELGLSKFMSGNPGGARRHFGAAMTLAEKSEPPDSLIVAFLLRNLANLVLASLRAQRVQPS